MHRRRLLHQQRAIGLHAVAVAAAEQAADRLAGRLAQDVPKRDVDAADGVGERAAPAHPEGVLCSFSETRSGSSAILAAIERLQHARAPPRPADRW